MATNWGEKKARSDQRCYRYRESLLRRSKKPVTVHRLNENHKQYSTSFSPFSEIRFCKCATIVPSRHYRFDLGLSGLCEVEMRE